MATEARVTGSERMVEVSVGSHRCAFPAAVVREVLRACAITPLPGAPPFVEGVVNVRGTPTPVIDLRARLGLARRPVDPSDHFLLVTLRDRPVLLRGDRVTDVWDVADAEVRPPEELATGETLAGVVVQDDGLLFVHDLARFLSEADQERLAELTSG